MLILALVLSVSSQLSIPLSQPRASFRSFLNSKTSHPSLLKDSKLYNHKEFFYTGLVQIGEPKQNFSLIIDTGSSYIWVEKFNCSSCMSLPHQFNEGKSSKYKNLNETISFSVIDKQYGDGSFVVGDLSQDQIAIGDNKSLTATGYFVLATKDNLTAADREDAPDGILGLGFKELSDGYDTLVDSLFSQKVIKKKVFALYLNRLGDIGEESGYGDKASSLEIGSYDINKYSHSSHLIVTQDIYPGLGYWFAQVNFEFMDLSIKRVSVVYDSGTTLIVVDSLTYNNLYNYLAKEHTCLEYGLIFCQCDSRDDMPDLIFYVDGHMLRIPSDRAWYSEEDSCVLLVQPSYNDFWILGAVFLQNFYTIHDMDKYQITFASLHKSFASIISIVSLLILS